MLLTSIIDFSTNDFTGKVSPHIRLSNSQQIPSLHSEENSLTGSIPS